VRGNPKATFFSGVSRQGIHVHASCLSEACRGTGSRPRKRVRSACQHESARMRTAYPQLALAHARTSCVGFVHPRIGSHRDSSGSPRCRAALQPIAQAGIPRDSIGTRTIVDRSCNTGSEAEFASVAIVVCAGVVEAGVSRAERTAAMFARWDFGESTRGPVPRRMLGASLFRGETGARRHASSLTERTWRVSGAFGSALATCLAQASLRAVALITRDAHVTAVSMCAHSPCSCQRRPRISRSMSHSAQLLGRFDFVRSRGTHLRF
jgi:hypothetical protein